MMKRMVLSAAVAVCVCHAASASSDGAWNAMFAKANGTCIGQSGLNTPEASAPVVFNDATGKVAVLLRGRSGRGNSKADVNLICLYDKKSGKASIAEYRWLGN
ncbi:hypothetical protein [Rhizobium tubonense]|uniref:Uncharacterized protein n=1 Tax=Rhizobium tubonense TaxID=484088 RepID=A0A2W4CXI3_9HYPH|nr:hypothetical protein [Rhizobium tubonense]PZM14915.1 hypothetical protein CPY51_09515 [Rhizobium tubonense]